MKLSHFIAIFGVFCVVSSFALVAFAQESATPEISAAPTENPVVTSVVRAPASTAIAHSTTDLSRLSRSTVLVVSLTVFALAVFVGFEVIAKVPPTLHTPLMSGSNAISGITVVGAIIAAGNSSGGLAGYFACFIAMIAIALATVNVVGGFMVTYRMLLMFKKR